MYVSYTRVKIIIIIIIVGSVPAVYIPLHAAKLPFIIETSLV